MDEKKKNTPFPAVWGLAACMVLIVSRALAKAGTAGLGSLSTVLVILALCLCLHLARRTSALTQPHVWNGRASLLLFMLPLVMLFLTVLQINLMRLPGWFASKPFLAVLILFSLPVFFCCWFLYYAAKVARDMWFRRFAAGLAFIGGAYVILRLANDVILPLIPAVPEAVLKVAALNPQVSILIYLIAAAGFIAVAAMKER